MIRVICVEHDDSRVAAGITDTPVITYKTFDVAAPELEQWLMQGNGQGSYLYRWVTGVALEDIK
jgi:hypothetical protein